MNETRRILPRSSAFFRGRRTSRVPRRVPSFPRPLSPSRSHARRRPSFVAPRIHHVTSSAPPRRVLIGARSSRAGISLVRTRPRVPRARVCPTDRDPEGPRLNWTARARPPKDAPRTDRGGDTASSNARAVSRERARESAKTRVEVSVVDRDASRRERGTRATTRGSITRRRREGKDRYSETYGARWRR